MSDDEHPLDDFWLALEEAAERWLSDERHEEFIDHVDKLLMQWDVEDENAAGYVPDPRPATSVTALLQETAEKDAGEELWCELETLANLYLSPEWREAWLDGQAALLMAMDEDKPSVWQPIGGHFTRAFDVVCSLIMIVSLSPMFCLIAAIIKLWDGGPVLCRHRRVGFNGRVFDCLTFPTETPTGSAIRKLGCVELPHLFNILKGDMTFVGGATAARALER